MSTDTGSPFAGELEPKSLVELLRWRASQRPGERTYTFLDYQRRGHTHLSYGELDRRARRIAAALQARHHPGERALLLYPPGPEYVEGLFGCLYAALIAVPVRLPPPDRSLRELGIISRDTDVSLILTSRALRPRLEARLPELPALRGVPWIESDALEETSSWNDPGLTGAEIALIQFSPGSAKKPTGVALCHTHFLYNSALIHACLQLASRIRSVSWLPPYYDMGLIGGIVQPLYSGFPTTLMSPLDFLRRPLRWLEAISRTRATASGGPYLAFELCAASIRPEQRERLDLRSWKLALVGGEPARPETLERFAAFFEPCGFRQDAFYPCHHFPRQIPVVSPRERMQIPGPPETRAAPVAGGTPRWHLIGCGVCPTSQHLAIVNPTTCHRCPPGQEGEIWLLGPAVAEGYWRAPDPGTTSWASYTSDTAEGPFLRTGDSGFIRDGNLFLTGRIAGSTAGGGRESRP